MDDFRRDDYRRNQLRSTYSPMPPRSRSERVGPPSRSARAGGSRQPKTGWRRFFTKKWIMLVLLTALLLTVGGCSAIMMSADMYKLDEINPANMPLASKVLDSKGNTVTQFGATMREYVPIETLRKTNPMLVEAFVKVEDRRFYEHNGVDFEGLGRAIVKNIVALGKAQGASTITQQVCKNIVLKDSNKTMTRKIKELGCALNLEKEASKDQILNAYLNYINFGGEIAGVQMAAKVYFGKDLTKQTLTPDEVAMLAGMPKAPNKYNPLTHPDKAKERRDVVLTQVMPVDDVIKPLITQQQAEELAKKPLNPCQDCKKKYAVKSGFDAFKDLVKRELKEHYDIDPDDLPNGGYQIVTGINVKAQKAIQEAMDQKELFTNKNGEFLKGSDSGVTMIDPHTGLIVAVGGGKEYTPTSRNRALELVQPGSTIKPLTVYTPAIKDHQYNEYSPVYDTPIQIGDWQPKNFSGGPKGQIKMVDMVRQSLNLSTVRLLEEVVKYQPAHDYAVQLGLPLTDADMGPAPLALGGLSKGVNTQQMAQAYSVFPNWGSYIPAHVIKEVKQNGERVEPKKPYDLEPKKVFDETSTWYMTRMLERVVGDDGTGHNAKLDNGWDVAGKTGTTQEGKSAWFVGYTPDLVCAVNVFYPTGKGPEVTGGTAPAKLFHYIMTKTLEGTTPKKFEKPEGVKDPEPPFKLEPPQIVDAKYIADKNVVRLKWNRMNERIKFQILRSEDGQTYAPVGEAGPGETKFEDRSIQPPDSGGGFLDQLFGGQPKTYWYKVVAIDTQATDPAQSSMESAPVQVPIEVKPEKKDEGNPDNTNGNGDNGGNNGGNNGCVDINLDTNNDGINDYTQDLNNDGKLDGDEDRNGDGKPDGDEDRNCNGIKDRYDPVGATGGTGGFNFKRKQN